MSSDGHDEFVKVVEEETCEILELPVESDDTLLLTTLQGQFPNAVGLRYQSSSGGWRGVRISGAALNPPHGGWGSDTTYHVTTTKGLKRKTEDPPKEKEEVPKKSSRHIDTDKQSKKDKNPDKQLLQDMIVFGLSTKCKDMDLKDYFTNACGEMTLHQVKYNRQTMKPRGFGFIRFKTVEGAKAALNGEHSIMGKTVKIKMSTKKEDPMKLFVGRIPKDVSAEDLKEYFEEFGEIKDAYIPQPARGFGFVTYSSSIDGRAALRKTHKMGSARLNVQFAEEKGEKMARRRKEEEDTFMPEGGRTSHAAYGNDFFETDSRNRDMWDRRDDGRDARDTRDMRDTRDDMRDDRRLSDYDSRGGNYGNNNALQDPASQLKGLLYSILGGH